MTKLSPWQRRIERAEELSRQHASAAEILGFYVHVARFQEEFDRGLSAIPQSFNPAIDRELTREEWSGLSARFESFLRMVGEHGPAPLAELTQKLRASGPRAWSELLSSVWTTTSTQSDAQGILAEAFLQPYAARLRSRGALHSEQYTYALCPFCHRKPGFGVLRQMGDGAARSLVCSFCLAEWDFRRIVCPGCGEENEKQLPVFTATDFDYIRVECCDTCKTYIKTVDLTRNGHAEPLVDELAAAPLDLWAREHGYAKLRSNILGM